LIPIKGKSRPRAAIKVHLEPGPPLLYIKRMRRDEVIARLKEAESALRARGIRRAAVFGSVARGEDRPDSDILVEFEPGQEGSIYDYVALQEFVGGLFGGHVDVVDRHALKPHLRGPSARDAIYAF
jgi:predicted nucleotidyltransferase